MKAKNNEQYSVEFEQFWKAYPYRRGSKWKAFGRFKEATGRGVPASEIITAAGRFHSLVLQQSKEPQYVPHATTWLNGRCWESIDDEEESYAASLTVIASRPSPAELTRRAVEDWIWSPDDCDKLSVQSSFRQSRPEPVGERTR